MKNQVANLDISFQSLKADILPSGLLARCGVKHGVKLSISRSGSREFLQKTGKLNNWLQRFSVKDNRGYQSTCAGFSVDNKISTIGDDPHLAQG